MALDRSFGDKVYDWRSIIRIELTRFIGFIRRFGIEYLPAKLKLIKGLDKCEAKIPNQPVLDSNPIPGFLFFQ